MAGLLQGINQALQNQSPEQRAMMLRLAAGASRNPGLSHGLAAQANDLIGISEQAKLNSLQQKQFDTQMELRREALDMERQERADRQARSEAFRTDMQRWLTAGTPEERQAVLSGSSSPDFMEYVGSIKPPNPSSFMEKLQLMGYEPGTPEFQQAARELANKSGTTVNVNTAEDFKVPTGYMRDPNNPAQVVPIPGGPAEGRTPEQAAKEQMLQVAQDQFGRIEQLLFNPDGSVNRRNLNMSAMGGVPFTAGKSLANAYEVGIQAITRNETGAAMPPEEVDNTRKRFQPGPLDSEELVKVKHQMYKDFISGGLKLVRVDKGGTPSLDEDLYNAELERRLNDRPNVDSILDKYLGDS